jgi:hypothetical protein
MHRPDASLAGTRVRPFMRIAHSCNATSPARSQVAVSGNGCTFVHDQARCTHIFSAYIRTHVVPHSVTAAQNQVRPSCEARSGRLHVPSRLAAHEALAESFQRGHTRCNEAEDRASQQLRVAPLHLGRRPHSHAEPRCPWHVERLHGADVGGARDVGRHAVAREARKRLAYAAAVVGLPRAFANIAAEEDKDVALCRRDAGQGACRRAVLWLQVMQRVSSHVEWARNGNHNAQQTPRHGRLLAHAHIAGRDAGLIATGGATAAAERGAHSARGGPRT